jgi:hypothetical protein
MFEAQTQGEPAMKIQELQLIFGGTKAEPTVEAKVEESQPMPMARQPACGGYEHAPQTKMLATHCAACGKALCDAASVEAGMGPDCRRRLMAKAECSDEARREANKLVYEIAVVQNGLDAVKPLARLRELGFTKLAKRIEERCVAVKIVEAEGRYIVTAPYVEASVPAWQRLPGRRWMKEEKANAVPTTARGELWKLLQQFYNGAIAVGPKGAFIIQ